MFRRIVVLLALLMPSLAMAQQGQTGRPASIMAQQVGGQDPSFIFRAFKVDADGALLISESLGTSNTGVNAGQVQGNSASGATDVGNPVKVGGVYNATLPTLSTGQRVIIASTAAITLLTVNGGTVFGGLTTLTVNGFERFIYTETVLLS